MDHEDLEDLDCEKADRSGHSFDGYQQNPYYSKITTAIRATAQQNRTWTG
jgi:hypothetical protein